MFCLSEVIDALCAMRDIFRTTYVLEKALEFDFKVISMAYWLMY